MSFTKNIKTKLVQKEKVFRVIALGQATGYPILLIGPPGTGKTNIVVDYINSSQATTDELFLIELDENTKPNEIKGQPDLKKLTEEKKWGKIRPITKAKYVMINEVDKANSGCRNAMLGIMNEKKIWDGGETAECVWESFIATCNQIPTEEHGSPFWDRFGIKFTVSRADDTELINYIMNPQVNEYQITVPTKDELEAIKLTKKKVEAFVKLASEYLSDRSLCRIADIVKAITVIYGVEENAAFLEAANLMCPAITDALSKKIEDPEVVALRTKIEELTNTRDITLAGKILGEIEALQKKIKDNQDLSKTERNSVANFWKEKMTKMKNNIAIEAYIKFEESRGTKAKSLKV